MTRSGTRRAGPFVVLGLVMAAVAAIIGLVLWIRVARTPKDPGAPAPSAASTTRAPRLRPARPPAHASIAGRVANPEGAPIAGAMVCATTGSGPMIPFDQSEPTCATSAQDGLYQINDLSPARFTLFASAPGHRPMGYVSPDPAHARFLDLRDGEARTGVDFKLPRGGVEVRGQVKDVGGGAIAGARVTLHGWMGPGQGADLVGEVLRDQAVDRLPLGRHRAPLGRGDRDGDLGELLLGRVGGERAVAEAEGPDQGAVHDEIGVAADRRGEVRIAAEVQAEMAVVLRRVLGLRLGAQHHLVDEDLVLRARDGAQEPVEDAGA